MPVSFPTPPRGPIFLQIPFLFAKPFDVIPAPNLTTPGLGYFAETQRPADVLNDGGVTSSSVRQFNASSCLRSLGRQYVDVTSHSLLNPVGISKVRVRGPFFWNRKYGRANKSVGGISRDNAGVALGDCTMMLFRTADRSFYGQTISDASGVWSIGTLESGPFFIVGYKVGAPDLASTSLNTVTSDLVLDG